MSKYDLGLRRMSSMTSMLICISL